MKARRNEPKREQTEANLVWPPTKEDLERLYVKEHLSAMKISKLYGLRYPNPKSGEAMILHYLKKQDIKRRDPAEHIRKTTEEMVDEWARRYQAGESLKDIAEGANVNSVTIFNHLHGRGIQPRDKVDAQIKAVTRFQRSPFKGNRCAQAYLLGFAWGDCSVEKHGRAVRVRSGTTHPEFVGLFKHLFGTHGRVGMYPKKAKVTPAEWNLEVDLDGSFEFLLEKNIRPVPSILAHRKLLRHFLAGFADAEGSIYYHRNGNRGGFVFQVSNTNMALLREIGNLLTAQGYHPRLYCGVSGTIGPLGRVSELWQLSFFRQEEVRKLLLLLPLRHKEKTTKAKLALLLTPTLWCHLIVEN